MNLYVPCPAMPATGAHPLSSERCQLHQVYGGCWLGWSESFVLWSRARVQEVLEVCKDLWGKVVSKDIRGHHQWLSSTLHYFHCWCAGDTSDLHLIHNLMWLSIIKLLRRRDLIIPVQNSQYQYCWCPGSLCLQDFGTHDIDYVD